MNIGDKVIVKDSITIVQEGEEKLLGQQAIIKVKDDFTFPIELEFLNDGIQSFYEELGKRRYDEFELTTIK